MIKEDNIRTLGTRWRIHEERDWVIRGTATKPALADFAWRRQNMLSKTWTQESAWAVWVTQGELYRILFAMAKGFLRIYESHLGLTAEKSGRTDLLVWINLLLSPLLAGTFLTVFLNASCSGVGHGQLTLPW